jgi:hypothetical protein
MTDRFDTHEDFSHGGPVKGGSDRAFGMVFAVVFTVIAGWPMMGGGTARLWSFGIAALLLVVALVRPGMLAPFNRLWTRFGLLLHNITNPVIMGLVFFVAVTPTAVIMRVLGKDMLNRRLDPAAESYWIERRPPGPEPETMKQQF